MIDRRTQPIIAAVVLVALLMSSGPAAERKTQVPKDAIITKENIDAYLAWKWKDTLERLQAAKTGRVYRTPGGRGESVFYDGRYTFASFLHQDIEIKRLEKELANPMAVPLPPFTRAKRQVNQIGSFARGFLHNSSFSHFMLVLEEIVDGEYAIIKAHGSVSGEEPFYWRFWLHSPLVAEFREGWQRSELPGAFKLAGKKAFQGQMLDLIEQYDLIPHLEHLNQHKKQAAAKVEHINLRQKADEIRQAAFKRRLRALHAEAGVKKQTQAALSALTIAKRFSTQGKTDLAKKWCQKVIEQYPDTEAAKEAGDLLTALKAEDGT